MPFSKNAKKIADLLMENTAEDTQKALELLDGVPERLYKELEPLLILLSQPFNAPYRGDRAVIAQCVETISGREYLETESDMLAVFNLAAGFNPLDGGFRAKKEIYMAELSLFEIVLDRYAPWLLSYHYFGDLYLRVFMPLGFPLEELDKLKELLERLERHTRNL